MGIAALVARGQPPTQVPPQRPILFARDVRPILAGACFKCHGPDEAARQAGLRLDEREEAVAERAGRDGRPNGLFAILPGDPARSEIIRRIRSTDPDLRMPPPDVNPHGLKVDDAALLERWITQGAPWSEHWSLSPLAARPAPPVRDERWPRSTLDRWVLARLEGDGLTPSPEASRAVLLRRASLDIIGLPPTPEKVAEFEADASDGAYERAVDRLLASDRFGEKWARWWLDLARYADTKGYEKDERRTMWPYRDWVIRALNADMPMDRFARDQLAGDMLPGASLDDRVASAFHRNTMTNDEGGTDDEEFRTAAVVDRVNTTMEVWQGLTAGCAQCHTHKFDPITHTDYFKLFALFNSTEDRDLPDDSPTELILSDADRAELDRVRARIDELDRTIAAALPNEADESLWQIPPPPLESTEAELRVWIDDRLPTGSNRHVEGLPGPWPWVTKGPKRASGERVFGGTATAAAQAYITDAYPPLEVRPGDRLFAEVYIDAANPPSEIMLQWFAGDSGWEHRATWGEARLTYGGTDGTASRRRIGDLPTAGQWVRLEFAAEDVGLAGARVSGWAFSQFGGTVHWDRAGVLSKLPIDTRHTISAARWLDIERQREGRGLPAAVRDAAMKAVEAWTTEDRRTVMDFYLRRVHAPTVAAIAPMEREHVALKERERKLVDRGAVVPIMKELVEKRPTHRFVRGSYRSPAEPVSPGAPRMLTERVGWEPNDRLELATWLFDSRNPLTARALANRVWEQMFGTGLVETVEDFGVQGQWPSHPELLDELAIGLRDGGWSLKALVRRIVTSATYRQSSAASAALLERDPANQLLARGPRFRLDGETLRDQALAASGLLSPKMFGKPVFPLQPDGLWIMIYSGDKWTTSDGEDRHRRSLYTFWRRTVPYPSMTTFDAPSREVCVSRRIRTNTPLQALVTLNDPVFVECARAMAARVMARGGEDAARIDYAFRLAAARAPTAAERDRLILLLERLKQEAAANDPAARGQSAWAGLCAVLLNLDEVLTKE
ncbi:MAG: PSD1 and planctomycete cytochrome C domain-containing protein [Phycisphaerales bacterium]